MRAGVGSTDDGARVEPRIAPLLPIRVVITAYRRVETGAQLEFGLLSLFERLFAHHRDERLDLAILLVDAFDRLHD